MPFFHPWSIVLLVPWRTFCFFSSLKCRKTNCLSLAWFNHKYYAPANKHINMYKIEAPHPCWSCFSTHTQRKTLMSLILGQKIYTFECYTHIHRKTYNKSIHLSATQSIFLGFGISKFVLCWRSKWDVISCTLYVRGIKESL